MKNFKYIWFTNESDYFVKIEIYNNVRDVFLLNKKTKENYFLKCLDVNNNKDADLYSSLNCITDFNYFINFINVNLNFNKIINVGETNEKE